MKEMSKNERIGVMEQTPKQCPESYEGNPSTATKGMLGENESLLEMAPQEHSETISIASPERGSVVYDTGPHFQQYSDSSYAQSTVNTVYRNETMTTSSEQCAQTTSASAVESETTADNQNKFYYCLLNDNDGDSMLSLSDIETESTENSRSFSAEDIDQTTLIQTNLDEKALPNPVAQHGGYEAHNITKLTVERKQKINENDVLNAKKEATSSPIHIVLETEKGHNSSDYDTSCNSDVASSIDVKFRSKSTQAKKYYEELCYDDISKQSYNDVFCSVRNCAVKNSYDNGKSSLETFIVSDSSDLSVIDIFRLPEEFLDSWTTELSTEYDNEYKKRPNEEDELYFKNEVDKAKSEGGHSLDNTDAILSQTENVNSRNGTESQQMTRDCTLNNLIHVDVLDHGSASINNKTQPCDTLSFSTRGQCDTLYKIDTEHNDIYATQRLEHSDTSFTCITEHSDTSCGSETDNSDSSFTSVTDDDNVSLISLTEYFNHCLSSDNVHVDSCVSTESDVSDYISQNTQNGTDAISENDDEIEYGDLCLDHAEVYCIEDTIHLTGNNRDAFGSSCTNEEQSASFEAVCSCVPRVASMICDVVHSETQSDIESTERRQNSVDCPKHILSSVSDKSDMNSDHQSGEDRNCLRCSSFRKPIKSNSTMDTYIPTEQTNIPGKQQATFSNELIEVIELDEVTTPMVIESQSNVLTDLNESGEFHENYALDLFFREDTISDLVDEINVESLRETNSPSCDVFNLTTTEGSLPTSEGERLSGDSDGTQDASQLQNYEESSDTSSESFDGFHSPLARKLLSASDKLDTLEHSDYELDRQFFTPPSYDESTIRKIHERLTREGLYDISKPIERNSYETSQSAIVLNTVATLRDSEYELSSDSSSDTNTSCSQTSMEFIEAGNQNSGSLSDSESIDSDRRTHTNVNINEKGQKPQAPPGDEPGIYDFYPTYDTDDDSKDKCRPATLGGYMDKTIKTVRKVNIIDKIYQMNVAKRKDTTCTVPVRIFRGNPIC